eukprot:2860649-Rhodomonas_salina.1
MASRSRLMFKFTSARDFQVNLPRAGGCQCLHSGCCDAIRLVRLGWSDPRLLLGPTQTSEFMPINCLTGTVACRQNSSVHSAAACCGEASGSVGSG